MNTQTMQEPESVYAMGDDQAEGRRQMKRYIREMYDPCEELDAADRPKGLLKYDPPIHLRSINSGPEVKSCEGRFYNIEFPLLNMREIKELQEKHRFSAYTPAEIEILLHNVRPKLDFKVKGKRWRQLVSRTPGTRVDIWELKDKFPKKLVQSQAKNIGVCYNRRRAYDDCFDELIRQDILDIPERGVLLLRIRDDVRKSVGFLKHMFEGTKMYGMKKATTLPSNNVESIWELKSKQKKYEWDKQQLEIHFELMKRKFQDEAAAESLSHERECQFYKSTIEQLVTILEMYKIPLIKMKGSTQSTVNVEKAWEKATHRISPAEPKPPAPKSQNVE